MERRSQNPPFLEISGAERIRFKREEGIKEGINLGKRNLL